jgi:transposase-like protein
MLVCNNRGHSSAPKGVKVPSVITNRAGLPSDVAGKMKALERENRELRQANEILRKASAYFAQAELDRPQKR